MIDNTIHKDIPKSKLKAFLLATALLLIYMSFVLALCLMDFSDMNINISPWQSFLGIRLDRIVHFIMFFPFPFFAIIFFKYNEYISISKKIVEFIIVILLGFIFAAIAESSQGLFTMYRQSDIYDFIANALGVLLGACIVYIIDTQVIKLFNFIFRNNN